MNATRLELGCYAAGVAAIALLSACGDAALHGAELEDFDSLVQRDELYVAANKLWGESVSVCWENWDANNPQAHNWVRDAIQRSWGFAGDIEFTGWGSCGRADIHITVSDSAWPRVTCGLGTDMCEMFLNFSQGSSYCGFGHADETYQSCTEFIGIHEFGHAIGFAHEQNRSDTPGACTQGAQGSNGTETYGAWDWDSVMNYCNPAYAAHPQLSITDQLGMEAYYGLNLDSVAARGAAVSLPLL